MLKVVWENCVKNFEKVTLENMSIEKCALATGKNKQTKKKIHKQDCNWAYNFVCEICGKTFSINMYKTLLLLHAFIFALFIYLLLFLNMSIQFL